ncbi:hypothetical protein EVAR_60894_1 [Eumeta japonica]|uniref:Uncharacterized protein n=1 Tax=Eumeta variegata TaxID=151549 RepID=A0A4C1YFP1_EUMVA|nr:hypothetical protein EVAR_60894_1 [Eumeta japonica]
MGAVNNVTHSLEPIAKQCPTSETAADKPCLSHSRLPIPLFTRTLVNLINHLAVILLLRTDSFEARTCVSLSTSPRQPAPPPHINSVQAFLYTSELPEFARTGYLSPTRPKLTITRPHVCLRNNKQTCGI